MFFRKFLVLVFIGLLVFGLIGQYGGRGVGRFESAYRQGFMDGQQAAAAGAEGVAGVAPDAAPGTNIYYRDHSLFFPGPALLLCLVPLFAFGLMAMKSGRRGHRGAWGPCGPGRGPWKHGSWEQGEDGPKEKSPDDIDDGPDDAVRYA